MELNKNYGAMNQGEKGHTWEWWTAEVDRLGSIHVHNKTLSGKWTYKITTVLQIEYNGATFETREMAYAAALARFVRLIDSAQKELLAEISLQTLRPTA